jgi:hypothetical protein
MAEQPVQPRADQHHDIGFGQRRRARRRRRLRVIVGQQPLGHRHRQEGNAGLLDKRTDVGVGLRVGRALAEDDERRLRGRRQIERTLDRFGCGQMARRGIDHAHEALRAGLRIERGAEHGARQIQIDTARPPRQRAADRARQADTDVLRPIDAVRGLRVGLRRIHLVELFVVALLQVDDVALARAADLDHREAVDGGSRQRDQAVEETRRRDREADAGLLRQKAGSSSGIAGGRLVMKADVADAFGLREARQVGDRNAGHAVDRVQAVQLQRIDDEVKAVRDR